MEEIVLEESTLKYRRPDIEGGYIYDKDDIDYYRATQRNDVLDNLLLGDFNMVGAYVINNAIVEELIKISKVYTEAYDKSIFCDSVRKFGKDSLHFRLNILKDVPTEGKVTASLEILESIDRANGYYQNTNTSLVDSHIFDDGKNIEEKIFKFYNISDRTKGTAKVENDYELPNILRRQAELERLRKLCLPTSARFEKELFEKRIRLLSLNIKSRNILEEFNRQVFHIKDELLDKRDPRYFRYLNQILDGILQQYGFEIAGEKRLLNNLTLLQVEYANKQFKQEAVRSNEIVRKDDKELRKYFKKEESKKQENINEVKPETKKDESKQSSKAPSSPVTPKTSNITSGTPSPKSSKKENMPPKKHFLGDMTNEKKNLLDNEKVDILNTVTDEKVVLEQDQENQLENVQ